MFQSSCFGPSSVSLDGDTDDEQASPTSLYDIINPILRQVTYPRTLNFVSFDNEICKTKIMYKELKKSTFQFEHCWIMLRDQPKWVVESEKKKQPKRPRAGTTSSPCTSDSINLGEDDVSPNDFVDLERPTGRKAEKERLNKRKNKESVHSSIIKTLEDIKQDKKKMIDKKIEIIDKVYVQKEVELRIMQEKHEVELQKHEMELFKEDERVILMDLNGLLEIQQEFYRARQMEIIKKRRTNYLWISQRATHRKSPQLNYFVTVWETFVWKRAATLGCPPAKRDSHTCSSWKNKIIIIGGEDSYDYYLSDVHILDADTLVWSKLFTSGQLLPPRAGHTTVALGKNLFVFGGFTDESNLYDDLYMLDIETGVWTQVMATGNGPCARFSMAGDSLDPQKSGILVFLGGCSKNLEALDDMFYLHTGLTTENERDERRLEKLSLRKQLKLKCQEQNMLTPPAYDKALVRIETNADLYQPIPMPSIEPSKPHIYSREYQPFPRKRTFQAKVTKCFPVGYTIETIIDGKILHGVLFSNKLSFNHIDDNSKRRKGAVEIDGVKLKDNQKSKSEIDSVHGKNTEAAAAAAATANTKSPAPSDASQPHEDAGNLKVPVVADINVEDNETGNAPNSSMEVHKENTSSADKNYHFVPNPRGQSIDC